MKLASIMVVFALVGCGGKKSDGKVASCLSDEAGMCREYRDDNLALGSESLAKLCTVVISTAKFTSTPCPTANVIASCQKDEGKDVYYTNYVGAKQAIETDCKAAGGTFATK